ncbi:hypothetical protein [Hydrogenophaga sp. BPS33]|uniref:hypothetical protein n=1 Tax=Hydrogenophaga sp. BPS33 TaxID=2651974 RepID=UPI001320375A|nr:hypothetical protein [Hydrogenophaga sp. BPS33]QHE85496.1 hypothetical protein F9K07_11590 [Hydrogenophaga sp. BPS33]
MGTNPPAQKPRVVQQDPLPRVTQQAPSQGTQGALPPAFQQPPPVPTVRRDQPRFFTSESLLSGAYTVGQGTQQQKRFLPMSAFHPTRVPVPTVSPSAAAPQALAPWILEEDEVLEAHPHIHLQAGSGYRFEDDKGRRFELRWSELPELWCDGKRFVELPDAGGAVQILGALFDAELRSPGEYVECQQLNGKILKIKGKGLLSRTTDGLNSLAAVLGASVVQRFGKADVQVVCKLQVVPAITRPAGAVGTSQ